MKTDALVALLREQGKTVATAESCTGGLIGKRLTDVSGSSAVYRGGVISYTIDVKRDVLGVPEAILAAHGAVSAETAQAMAEGVRMLIGADYAVSSTGLAGPNGDGSGKPVGLVYLAVASAVKPTVVREYHFDGNREQIRLAAAEAAEQLLADQI
ncbi:MAG: nicotinamide-nucleotide amidohydrolase family protein [Oscillospiraceae bacterium]|nr:nicotinamide-nucleotide amidohydrolase family protein [Oscillospiraceae bacterium]